MKKGLKNKNLVATIVMFFLCGLVVLADLLTKYLIYERLTGTTKFLPGFLRFDKVQNTGGPWGIFSGMTIVLSIVTVLFLALFLWYFLTKRKKSWLFVCASGFVVGGALGNLYDRLILGFVRDFLSFDFMNFPTFNVADAFICVGVVLFVIYFAFFYAKEVESDKKFLAERGFDQTQPENIATDDLDKPTAVRFSLRRLVNNAENETDAAQKTQDISQKMQNVAKNQQNYDKNQQNKDKKRKND